MVEHDFARRDGEGCVISVDVTPGAASTEITGVNRWRRSLKVKIAAEARDGAANEELARFLSELLDAPRREVAVVRGHRSTRKVVRVPGDPESVASRLLEAI
jgi:uncharacterized protein (TIGR00251 family)